MSSETIDIEYTKIYTLLKIHANSAHMLGSASVMSLFPLSSYLVRLVYWLRTWMPLAEILYSLPGCLALNLGFGMGLSHWNPTNGSLPKL